MSASETRERPEFGMICFPSRAVAITILATFQSAALLAKDPGCEVPVLVSTGGARPQNPQTLAIRWTGYSNFELVYKGQVILLDAYFDRGSEYPSLGFKAADIKKADAILMGHAHFDHMSDAASVSANTKALVVGAPITTDKLLSQGLDPKLIKPRAPIFPLGGVTKSMVPRLPAMLRNRR
jgi:glyoxylase-like metal-dependent hydrolase (beta-lactamase superfamily II)